MEAALSNSQVIVLALAIAFLMISAQLFSIRNLGVLYRRKWTRDYRQAKALILSVSTSRKRGRLKVQVKIQVQVLPDAGRNFVSEINTQLSRSDLSAFYTGKSLLVRYDPMNFREVTIVQMPPA